MKTTGTNAKLRKLLTAIRNRSLIPQPEFQRRLVWTTAHKRALIDTVLKGYPFPEVYIAAGDVDPISGEGTEMLVDGQQRLTTLDQYFNGSSDLKLGTQIQPYAELPDPAKRAFLEYEVVVRDLGNVGIDEIKEVFQRINSTKYSLNAMEIHNARYDGAFKQFGEAIAQNPFFERHRVFSTQEIRRMQDTVFALTFVITIMSTYFNRDSALEEYLKMYNDDDAFAAHAKIEGQIARVFSFIDQCNFPDSSRAWKKADLLTLLVEIHRALIKKKIKLSAKKVKRAVENFYRGVGKVDSGAKAPKAAIAYHNRSIQATNDRGSRIERGRIIYQVITGQKAAADT